jgi:hypothetical protein
MQEAKRAEFEQLRRALASEQESLQEALEGLAAQEQQQAADAADLAAREAALAARASALSRDQAALAAGQAAALRQVDALEGSLRSKLESHQTAVSELLARGLADLEDRAAELAQRQERLTKDLTSSSSSMAASLQQQRCAAQAGRGLCVLLSHALAAPCRATSPQPPVPNAHDCRRTTVTPAAPSWRATWSWRRCAPLLSCSLRRSCWTAHRQSWSGGRCAMVVAAHPVAPRALHWQHLVALTPCLTHPCVCVPPAGCAGCA